MTWNRRRFLQTAALGTFAAAVAPGRAVPTPGRGVRAYRLSLTHTAPVVLASVEVLEAGGLHFIRVRSAEGAEGVVQTPSRTLLSMPLLKEWIIPYFLGQDARELERIEDDFYFARRHYKMTGIGLWRAFGSIELALLDMLGKIEGKPVGALFGPLKKDRIAVYASRFEREQPVAESLARLERDLAAYGNGVQAVKLKIGGRMSRDADAFQGRTEAFIPAARKLLGDAFTLFVDANGSYYAPRAIEVGLMLQDYGVKMYEEPCVFEDYEGTKTVTAALNMPVSGGEQDWSMWTWERMVRERIVDIVQPDFMMAGGFIRCLKIAAMAEAAGMEITPHSPIWGPASAIKAQFASLVPNAGHFQEHRARRPAGDWFAPQFLIDENGTIPVPKAPGWGITYDDALFKNANVL